MHLADPSGVIAEMARVVRPGGRVVVVEPDSEIVLLDSGLVDLTRRLLAYRATGYADPWAGRQVRRLMLEAGLTDVRATVDSMAFTDLAEAEARLRLISTASAAAGRGILTTTEASQWEEDLRDRDAKAPATSSRSQLGAVGPNDAIVSHLTSLSGQTAPAPALDEYVAAN